MKKFFLAVATVACAATMMTSCNNAPKANDAKAEATALPTELKIAYVEVDSIMSQYTFSKENQEALQKKMQNIQNTLAAKQQQLEAAAAKLQQDYQANALTADQAQLVSCHSASECRPSGSQPASIHEFQTETRNSM